MIGKYLQLDNGLKFVVLDRIQLDGQGYLFLASVTEEVQYIFARTVDPDGIEPVVDGELLLKLTTLVSKKILNNN